MEADLDPFASTSFLDLLACSLCVAIVLALFAGSDKSTPTPPTSSFVSIEEVQGSAHFGQSRVFAIAIGDLVLIAPRMLISDDGFAKARNVAVHVSETGTCDRSSLERGSIKILSALQAFGFDEADEFKKAVRDAYGLDVSVDANSNVLLNVSLARSSYSQRHAPESLQVFVEDRAADTSVSLWTTSSASLEGGSMVLPSPFSIPLPDSGVGRSVTPTEVPRSGPIPYRSVLLACVSARNTGGKTVMSAVSLPVKVVTVVWRKTRAPRIEGPETVALTESIANETPRR